MFSGESGSIPLVEKIDLYDPVSGAYRGKEVFHFTPDGRRLRWEIYDKDGKNTLRFFLIHDGNGRDAKAIYFEDTASEPSIEQFTYRNNGRLKITQYISRNGAPSDRTEAELDEQGREIGKRYYRPDGKQYGSESVYWYPDGTQKGWDFTYISSKKLISFRYDYIAFDKEKNWIRRLKSRDGVPERIEVRTVITERKQIKYRTPALLAPGIISTGASESSPSFAADGKSMVFARYGAEWTEKHPYYARLEEDGWKVEPLRSIGQVYNLAISPDGKTVFYSTRKAGKRQLYRIRKEGERWSSAENLTQNYGLNGTYPNLGQDGTLYFYDAGGAAGDGIYQASPVGNGFSRATPLYVPKVGTNFDAYTKDGRSLLVTRCFDDACISGPMNGLWQVSFDSTGAITEKKLDRLPYAWGGQPIELLGLFVFTDGNDILAIPLRESGFN